MLLEYHRAMKDQWIEWLQEKQRHFFYGIILVVACFFVAFQVFGKFHKPRVNSFLVANQAFEKWMVSGEAFEKLDSILKANPKLEPKYQSQIIDKLLVQNNGEKASPLAQSVFRRVLQQTPQHTDFAEATLLISKGDYRDALVRAVSLKENLDPTSIIYGFNLLRIASLYCELKDHDQELASLEELEQYISTNVRGAKVLTDCFSEGNTTLLDYISHRKQ